METVSIELLQVKPNGNIDVLYRKVTKRIVVIDDEEREISDVTYHSGNGPIVPGRFENGVWLATDLTSEPLEIQAAAVRAWTPAVVEAFKQSVQQAAFPLNVRVNAERDRRIADGFKFRGVAYQLDEKSKTNVIAKGAQAKFAVQAGAIEGDLRWTGDPDVDFGWIATDNTITPMDAQTMSAFADAADSWFARHIMAGTVIKAMTPPPVDVAVDALWPTQLA